MKNIYKKINKISCFSHYTSSINLTETFFSTAQQMAHIQKGINNNNGHLTLYLTRDKNIFTAKNKSITGKQPY